MKDIDTPQALLSKAGLFDHLSPAELTALAQHAQVAPFKKNGLLFSEGQRADCIFVLVNGMVELFASRRNREATVLIMWAPAVFLPAAALSDEPYLLSGRALTSARTVVLDGTAIRDEVGRSAALGSTFTNLMAAQFRLLVRQIKDQKLRNGSQRLCAFLTRLLRETGTDGYADLPIAKAILASRLGMTPENLSRSLRVVKQNGIEVRGTRVILTDPARASRFCDPDPLFDGPDQNLRLNHF